MKSTIIDPPDLLSTDRASTETCELENDTLADFKRLMDHHLSCHETPSIPSPIELCAQKETEGKPCETGTEEEKDLPKEEILSEPPLSNAFALFTPTFSSFTANATPQMRVEPLSASTLEAFALLDRVCTEMLVLTSEGSTQTTIVLNNPEFSSSTFHGAEILIEEFSTAPKIFNVKITASPQAVELLQAHIGNFMESFQERRFPFSINRVDTDLGSSSKALFSRKEKTGREDLDDDQKGDKQS